MVQTAADQGWTRLSEPAQFGGYCAWESAHLPASPAGSNWHVPVFLALEPVTSGPVDLVAAMRMVLTSDLLLMSVDERDLLATEIERSPQGWPYEMRIVGYAAIGDLGRLPGFCHVLHVGAPVLLRASRLAERPVAQATAIDLTSQTLAKQVMPPPIVAVIDDGIAYLNARFRSAPQKTRFDSIWLQAPEILDPAGVMCGRVLSRSDIDSLLASGARESEVYREINRTLQPDHHRQSTNHLASHGTHVLDIAAGACVEDAKDAAIRTFPILAVQLPSAALHDTSGRRLEGYVVQGLRWLMAQALRQSKDGTVAPMVVNLSLGSLAGPGDESAFLADWMQFEMRRYARLLPRAVLRIVAAYGNARRARLVARSELRAARDMALDWCILPDDHTASFLELRADTSRASSLRLHLVPPDPALPTLDVEWPAPGESWCLGSPALAMVTGVSEPGHRMVHIATAPTAGTVATAPAGRWQVRISTKDEAPALISMRVQRDDTPAGYRVLGRQSRLDHDRSWDWDEVTRDWTAPQSVAAGVGCPITREGTPVAFAGTTAPGVYFVGAVRPVTGGEDQWQPTLYTASGVVALQPSGESLGPSLAASGDDGVFLAGRRASGVLSGSTARISGTSVAAPAVVRALALYLDRRAGLVDPVAELRHLLGGDPLPEKSALVGYGVLAAPADPVLVA